MIAGLLVRHYKNYANLHFVPISDRASHMYSIFVGNNGVGKSAVLEAIDVVLNNRYWNVTAGMKKTEAYICPIYLIEKSKLEGDIASKVEIISNLLWSVDESVNPIFKSNEELKKWMEYKNRLKEKYETSHYFVMIGKLYDNSQAYVASLQDSVKKEIGYKLAVDEESAQKVLDEIKKEIEGLYRYIYIPVEESPNELLKLQNSAMQQLLNKNVLE